MKGNKRTCADNRIGLERTAKASQRDSGSSQREEPESQEGWATGEPEEVCCHSDQCGLFFFWLPLLHASHVLGSGCHDNSTTPVSHSAEIGSEKKRNQTEWKGTESGMIRVWKKGMEKFAFLVLGSFQHVVVNFYFLSWFRMLSGAFKVSFSLIHVTSRLLYLHKWQNVFKDILMVDNHIFPAISSSFPAVCVFLIASLCCGPC